MAHGRAGAEHLERTRLARDAVDLDRRDRLDVEPISEVKPQRHRRSALETEVGARVAADHERRAHHAEQPARAAQHP